MDSGERRAYRDPWGGLTPCYRCRAIFTNLNTGQSVGGIGVGKRVGGGGVRRGGKWEEVVGLVLGVGV